MEEVYEKSVTKSRKKRNIAILLVIVVIFSVFLISYGQINSDFLLRELNQTECQEKLSQWCTDCFSKNNGYTNIWENSGTRVEEDLAKCSNKYFQTGWAPEQDCTGNALDNCLNYIME
jgi:hypothetical protein